MGLASQGSSIGEPPQIHLSSRLSSDRQFNDELLLFLRNTDDGDVADTLRLQLIVN